MIFHLKLFLKSPPVIKIGFHPSWQWFLGSQIPLRRKYELNPPQKTVCALMWTYILKNTWQQNNFSTTSEINEQIWGERCILYTVFQISFFYVLLFTSILISVVIPKMETQLIIFLGIFLKRLKYLFCNIKIQVDIWFALKCKKPFPCSLIKDNFLWIVLSYWEIPNNFI